MTGKKLLSIAYVAMITIGLISMMGFAPVGAVDADEIELNPASVIYSTAIFCQYLGTTFTVDLEVTNVVNLAGLQFWLHYNTTLLQVVNFDWKSISEGGILAEDAGRTDTNTSYAPILKQATVYGGATTPTNGSGLVGRVTFKIIYCPPQVVGEPTVDTTVSCALDLDDSWTYGTDDQAGQISFTTITDGYYEYTTEGVGVTPPTANFIWSPTIPTVSDTVTVTSTSTAGSGSIIGYIWTVTGGADTVVISSMGGDTTVYYDYYVKGMQDLNQTGDGSLITAPVLDTSPAGWTFLGADAQSGQPWTNLTQLGFWGGRYHMFSGVEGDPFYGANASSLDITNDLGYDVIVKNLTAEVVDATETDLFYDIFAAPNENFSIVAVDVLDQYYDWYLYDEVDYNTGVSTVKRLPDLDWSRQSYGKPTSYNDLPIGMLENDLLGDAAATGHVAPLVLADSATLREYFGTVAQGFIGTNGTVPTDHALFEGTIRFALTYGFQGSSLTFHCNSSDPVDVTLYVVNEFGGSAQVTKQITQRELVGGDIDMWTTNVRFCGQLTTHVGKGYHEPADAISPDVEVGFLALVTWGGAPLAHRLVAFEIIDGEGHNVLTRTAETNKSGVAIIWWRMPIPNPPGYDDVTQVWNSTVSVKIQDIKYEDIMPFKVGYVVDIIGLLTDKVEYDIGNWDGEGLDDGDMIYVTVTLKNIMMMPKEVFLVVMVEDNCNVPILKLTDEFIIEEEYPWCESTVMNVTLSGQIPHWAYVGLGNVYANVYTRAPFECGTAYSPEESVLISLVWGGELFDP